MDSNPPRHSPAAKILRLALKLAVTGLCAWYVLGKIDLPAAGHALRRARLPWLLPALLAFVVSKLLSAVRLNRYLRDSGLALTPGQNTRLYWLGMFYNLFLPGSIGGDAYKVVLLSRRYPVSYKKIMAAVLTDRFSGLLGLGLLLAAASFFVFSGLAIPLLLAAGSLMTIAAAWGAIARWLPAFRPRFFPALWLGLAVQVLQALSVCCIIWSLGISAPLEYNLFLFLLSSVASVLPFTIGGLGIRELVFLQGSRWLGTSGEEAVVISLLFYLITLATSAAGALYVFRDPLGQKK